MTCTSVRAEASGPISNKFGKNVSPQFESCESQIRITLIAQAHQVCSYPPMARLNASLRGFQMYETNFS